MMRRSVRSFWLLFLVGSVACGSGDSDDEPIAGNDNAVFGNNNRNPDDNTVPDDNTNDNGNFVVPDDVPDEGVALSGRGLYLDGEPFIVRGVCWSPVPKGQNQNGIDFAGAVDTDAALMAEAGINVVRTYGPITDTDVLDTLLDNGIYVMMTVYNGTFDSAQSIRDAVNAVKDHPAVLMWLVGNEWNYNNLFGSVPTQEAAIVAVDAAAAIIQGEDDKPVATVYGELPTPSIIAALPNVDVWGLNVYRFDTFGNLFNDWRTLSDKPMWLGEYGADAYNANIPGVDLASQASATTKLTELIIGEYFTRGGAAFGGTIFSWNDEWWKDQGAGTSVSTQDAGGSAPGGGPFPDGVFNEEYWGIVDIDRNTRPAYDALKALYNPG